MAALCATFLVGILATSLAHVHPTSERQHGAQDQHDHESLTQAHRPGWRNSDAVPPVVDCDHGPNEWTAIYLSRHSVSPKAPSASPGLPAVIVGACHDPALRSNLELCHTSHPRASAYLIGPGLRGPPAA